jgi:hypothetical protein
MLIFVRKYNITYDPGATLCEVLDRRGEIMRNLRDKKPFKDWHLSTIIAWFCSGMNKDHSFSKFYKETRTRLMINLYDSFMKRDSTLQVAYTLACMEFEEFEGLGQYGHDTYPTVHIRRFAQLLRKFNHDLEILGNHQATKTRTRKIANIMSRLGSADLAMVPEMVKKNARFMFPKVGIKPKPKPRKRPGRNGTGLADKDTTNPSSTTSSSAGCSFMVQEPTIVFDNSWMPPHLNENEMLRALLRSTPDMSVAFNVDIVVPMDDIGDLGEALDDSVGGVTDIMVDEMEVADGDEAEEDFNDAVLFVEATVTLSVILRRDKYYNKELDLDMDQMTLKDKEVDMGQDVDMEM